MNVRKTALLALAPVTLAGCMESFGVEGTTRYTGSDSYIAVAQDYGRDSGNSGQDNAAIAVTPDGCQTWYIDDGLEARASNRLDPVSGLPVCEGTPGVVYGPYASGTQGIPDRVPARPATVVRTEQVEIRPTGGIGQEVHHPSTPHH